MTSLLSASSSNSARQQPQCRAIRTRMYLLFISSCSDDCAEVKDSRSSRILQENKNLIFSSSQASGVTGSDYWSNDWSISGFPVKGEETALRRLSNLNYAISSALLVRTNARHNIH